MSAAKHTPGPWEVVADHPQNACVKIQPVNRVYGGHEVATLYGCEDPPCTDGVWGDQPIRDADARLIAAAPELLEALGDLSAWCGAYDMANIEHGTLLPILNKARAAIAKAEVRS